MTVLHYGGGILKVQKENVNNSISMDVVKILIDLQHYSIVKTFVQLMWHH